MASRGPVPREAVERELVRITETDVMRRSPTHTRLLRYLVARALDGDDDALTETAIAIAVFRRDPSSYDARTDPIVRVTAGRLRARLAREYVALDAPTAVRIELPRGGYAPAFVAAAAAREGVAVLRARNASGDASLDAFCVAQAERLADALAAVGVPRVVSRDSVERAQDASDDVVAIGERLGVEWIVETAVSTDAGDALRVTARLLGADDAGVRWVETAARAPALRFEAADLVVDRAVARFAAALRDPTDVPRVDGARTAAAQVQQQIDLVRFLLRQRSPASVAQAVALAEALTREHPASAAAWADLGNARLVATGFMDTDAPALLASALEAARRALALDPRDVTARTTEGALVGVYLRDPERAIALLRPVTRAAPRHGYARVNLAVMLQYVGRFDDAIAELEAARFHDPLAAYPVTNIAIVHAFARRHDEARRLWTLARLAGSPPWLADIFEGTNELWAGDATRARAHFVQAREREPARALPWMCVAMADAAAGDHEAARAQVDAAAARFPHLSHFTRAQVAAVLGDRDGVLRCLGDAAQAHDPLLVSAPVNPTFAWLARDARYNAFLRAQGLSGWRGAPPP